MKAALQAGLKLIVTISMGIFCNAVTPATITFLRDIIEKLNS